MKVINLLSNLRRLASIQSASPCPSDQNWILPLHIVSSQRHGKEFKFCYAHLTRDAKIFVINDFFTILRKLLPGIFRWMHGWPIFVHVCTSVLLSISHISVVRCTTYIAIRPGEKFQSAFWPSPPTNEGQARQNAIKREPGGNTEAFSIALWDCWGA